MDCTLRYQSLRSEMRHFAQSTRWVQITRQRDDAKCHVRLAWLYKVPIIQATIHPECSSTFPNCNVSAAVLFSFCLMTRATGQWLWHTDTHSHDLSVGETQPCSMKAAIQHQPQIATFFLWELCTLDSHCFNKSLIMEIYIVATASTSGNSL